MTQPGETAQFRLSPSQQAVVDHRGSDLQVIACAGSGKTESMARRVAALVQDGCEPSSIVAFTFTERAAEELKERISRRIGELLGQDVIGRLASLYVGTIHAYCFRLLQDHVPEYGNYDILDENRHVGLLAREVHTLGLSRFGRGQWDGIRNFAQTLDVLGNELVPTEDIGESELAEAVIAYGDMLDRYRVMTFSSLISRAVAALQDPVIHAKVHGALSHLLVDEYQDINPAQERLIELLSASPVVLTVVGDDDQSIYQWRGSDVNNIVSFATRRRPSRTIGLDVNRRSAAGVVRAAAAFATSIPGRLDKEMQPTRQHGSAELNCWQSESDVAEAEDIADTIARLHGEGFRFRDIAVLFRSVRTAAPPLLAALERRDIPFTCVGRTGLFLQPDIALLGELYAGIAGGDWQDARYAERRPADLDRVVAGLAARFPYVRGGAEGLREYLDHWQGWLRRTRTAVSLVGDYYKFLEELGARHLDPDAAGDAARLGALARFSEVLADFEHVHRRGHKRLGKSGQPVFEAAKISGKAYLRALHRYLLHWARDAYEDFAGDNPIDVDAVQVLTVHQSKGLEWPVVFVGSLVAGRFPSRMAGRPGNWLLPESVFPAETRVRYEGSDAEERRLFYVAMTRARDALYLSGFKRLRRRVQLSPYLLEVADGEALLTAPLPLPPSPVTDGTSDAPSLELSFSDLVRVEECGHAWRLGGPFGFQPELATELNYGRALHHVLHLLAEVVRETGRVPDRDDLDALLDDGFYMPFATGAVWIRMRNAAGTLVRRYVEKHIDDLRRVWSTERPFELHLPDGTVRGRADVILDLDGDGGKLGIVDYKVADDPSRDPTYRLQLQVYAAAGRAEGLDVANAWLHPLREGERSPVDVSELACSDALRRLEVSINRVRQGDLPPRPSITICGRCDFASVCAHRSTDATWSAP